jgi:hypothetical protein
MRKSKFLLIVLLFIFACNGQNNQPVEVVLPIVTDAPSALAYETLAKLTETEIPPRNLADLTVRYKGIAEVPAVALTEPIAYELDNTATFWIKNQDSNQNLQVEATLLYLSDELLFWVDKDTRVPNRTVIQEASAILENEILPRNRELFGTELRPGIDGDNRLQILHSNQLGDRIIGYFAAADEFVTEVNKFSNEREMLYINTDNAKIGSDGYYEVIAHELQHLIQWHTDSNEAAWLGEGLSELAAYANGFNEVEFEAAFAQNPDTQLNDWDVVNSSPHYGASFLLMAYYWDQFGEEAVKRLVMNPANGLQSLEEELPAFSTTFPTFFNQWTATNFLYSHGLGFDNYQYAGVDLTPLATSASHNRFPASSETMVRQFGTDYIEIKSNTPVEFSFVGTRQVGLMPIPERADSQSSNTFWTTLPADESDQTLTRPFDLSALSAATLIFWSWYDIEAGWDYAYVAVSTDDGATWATVDTIYTTNADPQGHNYGNGLTGLSGTGDTAMWVEQTADLTEYAGKNILLRFEYITDQAVHNAGFALDDVAIPELDFSDDMENGDNGWQTAGFVRHNNILPQQFSLQLLLIGDNVAQVEPLPLAETQQGSWTLPLSPEFDTAVVVVSGMTDVTKVPASYRYEITN